MHNNTPRLILASIALAGYTATPYLAQVSWSMALAGDIAQTLSLFTIGYLFGRSI